MSELKTHAEIIDFINELEDKFPVNNWKSKDIHLWPLIRIQLAYTIFGAVHNESQPKKKEITTKEPVLIKKNWTHKFKAHILYRKKQLSFLLFYKEIIQSFKKKVNNYFFYKKLYSSTNIVVLSFSANRTLLSGKWYNRQIDPLLEYFLKNGISAHLLEFQNYSGYRYPLYNNSLALALEEHLSKYSNSSVFTSFTMPALQLESYQNFITYIKSRIIDIDIHFLEEEKLPGFIKLFWVYVDYFNKILSQKRAKLCFVTCYYDMKFMAVCVACRKLGIPVVDLQHGVESDFHVAYGKWSNVPEGGYAMLPGTFWCWSEQEVKTIHRWSRRTPCPDTHRALAGGNPWLALWTDGSTALVKRYDALVKRIKFPQAEAVHILYSMQPIDNALPNSIIEAINLSPVHWKWWIRMHPRQEAKKEYYRKLLLEKCNISTFNYDEASYLPLPALLRHTQIHITHWSSVVLEAAEFQVPSLLIHSNGKHLYKEQIDNHIAFYIPENTSDIIVNIKNQLIEKRIAEENKLNKFHDTLYQLLQESAIIR